MRTTHIKSNVVNNGVPKLPTSDAIYYGEIAINYGASGETLSIKNSNDEIVPFSSDNAINKAFEVHAQSLIDLDGRIVELKETKVESEEFNKIVSDLNQKLSAASESLDNLYSEIVNLTDKINENEVVISESLCDLDKRIKKIDTSYNNPTLTAITFNSIAWVTGLKEAIAILDGIEGLAIVNLNQKDIVRHKLVTRIVNAYEKYDKQCLSHPTDNTITSTPFRDKDISFKNINHKENESTDNN